MKIVVARQNTLRRNHVTAIVYDSLIPALDLPEEGTWIIRNINNAGDDWDVFEISKYIKEGMYRSYVAKRWSAYKVFLII